jgi:hypothetical protein
VDHSHKGLEEFIEQVVGHLTHRHPPRTKYKKKIFKSDDIFVAIGSKRTTMSLEVDERPKA